MIENTSPDEPTSDNEGDSTRSEQEFLSSPRWLPLSLPLACLVTLVFLAGVGAFAREVYLGKGLVNVFGILFCGWLGAVGVVQITNCLLAKDASRRRRAIGGVNVFGIVFGGVVPLLAALGVGLAMYWRTTVAPSVDQDPSLGRALARWVGKLTLAEALVILGGISGIVALIRKLR